MKEKSPAFQFYPKDLLADPVAIGLGNELLGVYLKLLCFDWMDDGILDDGEHLVELTNLKASDSVEMSAKLDRVRVKFVQHPTKQGFITNPRLQKERERQESYRARGQAGGKQSAKQSAKQRATKAQAKFNTPSPSPSPSPSPKKIKPIDHPSDDRQAGNRFERIWSDYPERKGKQKALRHFKAQVKTDQDWSDIQTALANYKTDMARIRGNGHPDRAWQHGGTWFNGYWRDYVDYQPAETGDKWDRIRAEYEAERLKTKELP